MRVKRGLTSRKKHHKLLRANKGYRMTKRRLIQPAREAFLHAGEYAFAGRRRKKRDFRRAWITRISEAVKLENMNYSTFVKKLKDAHIEIDRKIMSHLIISHPAAFKKIIEKTQSFKTPA